MLYIRYHALCSHCIFPTFSLISPEHSISLDAPGTSGPWALRATYITHKHTHTLSLSLSLSLSHTHTHTHQNLSPLGTQGDLGIRGGFGLLGFTIAAILGFCLVALCD